jgi:hypothetical protein
MSNTIYIDSNKANCINQEGDENAWTYKLNTELLLPKGTQISVQNAFINKKGITGGSIEIDEDIEETLSYTYYITETPHFKPVNEYSNPLRAWFRSTLHCAGGTYRGMFSNDATDTGTDAIKELANRVVYGIDSRVNTNATPSGSFPTATFPHLKFPPLGDAGSKTDAATTYNKDFKTPDFALNGGTGMVCPMMKVVANGSATGGKIFEPVIDTITIRVPKGVYGIGELGQLIEDQFNGVKVYDAITKSFKNSTLKRREDNLSRDAEFFDGQPYNLPFFKKINCVRRDFRSDEDTIDITGDRGTSVETNVFMNMRDYRKMVEFKRDTAITPSSADELDLFSVQWAQGQVSDDGSRDPDNHPNRYIKPFFMIKDEKDDGVGSRGNVKDSDAIFGYNYHGITGIGDMETTALIGTSNFSFKYDTEKNGFSMNGLHNVFKEPSHDRYANANSTAGQQVVYYKKSVFGTFGENNLVLTGGSAAPDSSWDRLRRYRATLDRPETRDMGIMIINWSRETSIREGVEGRVKDESVGRFGDFFDTLKDAKKAWEKTLWSRLGFSYEQCNDDNTYGTSNTYAETDFVIKDYGFTTDAEIDNSVISTISSLTNPLNVSYSASGSGNIQVGGFQWFGNIPIARTDDFIGSGALPQPSGSYGGNRYTGALSIPAVISDVGGLVAARLPILSKSAYFILTSDVLDNFKDNVKRGDILPILSIIPKSSLSNEDFIASQSDIVQVLSQDKVVNKIKLAVYNPDMTAPTLDPNSSVVLKITLPNKTPMPLLPPPEQKAVAQEQAQLVGS